MLHDLGLDTHDTNNRHTIIFGSFLAAELPFQGRPSSPSGFVCVLTCCSIDHRERNRRSALATSISAPGFFADTVAEGPAAGEAAAFTLSDEKRGTWGLVRAPRGLQSRRVRAQSSAPKRPIPHDYTASTTLQTHLISNTST